MNRRMQLHYIAITAFTLYGISLRCNSRGSAMTNHKKLIDFTGPELSFFHKRKDMLKIDQCKKCRDIGLVSSSETQGRLAGARGNKSGKEMKRRRFTSKAERAPGNRLLPDHFQTALPMLPPDWAEKSFVLFCPIGEQQLLRYCSVFLHDDFRIAILALFVYQCSACEGNFHFNFLRERQNIEMMTRDTISDHGHKKRGW